METALRSSRPPCNHVSPMQCPLFLPPCPLLNRTHSSFYASLRCPSKRKAIYVQSRKPVFMRSDSSASDEKQQSASKQASSVKVLSSLLSAIVDRFEDTTKEPQVTDESPVSKKSDVKQANGDDDASKPSSNQSVLSLFSKALQVIGDRQKGEKEVKEEGNAEDDIKRIALTSFLVGLAGSKSAEDKPDESERSSNMTEKRDRSHHDSEQREFSVASLFAAFGKRVGDEAVSLDEVTDEKALKGGKAVSKVDGRENGSEKDAEPAPASEMMIGYLKATLESLLKKSDKSDKGNLEDKSSEKEQRLEPVVLDEARSVKEATHDESKEKTSLLSLSSLLSAISARYEKQDATKEAPQIEAESTKQQMNGGALAPSKRSQLSKETLQPNKESNPILFSLLSSLSSRIEDVTTSNLRSMMKTFDGEISDLSQQAILATMRAIGVEPFDRNEEDLKNLPRRPLDPLLALILAGYSFRAYDEPPANSYRETFVATVPGSALSGLTNQIIHTEFAYPDASVISCHADGLFLIDVVQTEELDDCFVTADVNGAVVLDILSKKNFSVLRQSDLCEARKRNLLGREPDEIELHLYPNKNAYEAGRTPTHTALISVADLVKRGLGTGTKTGEERYVLTFEEVSEDERRRDYFQYSLLPKELKLPFQNRDPTPSANGEDNTTSVGTAELAVSFVPFNQEPEDDQEEASTMSNFKRAVSDALASALGSSKEVPCRAILDSQLTPGALPAPTDWMRLASAGRSLLDEFGSNLPISRTSTLRENLPGVLFIESLATGTEVWLFRDEAEKNVVVSFRGTEQVSWRDFFTDAQLFLQRWTPGEEIDLDVDLTNTVGLADMVPSIFPAHNSPIPDDAPAVHYGFLRAYFSVRDGVLRGIRMLTEDLSEDYALHFTGHSLGGALAILASSDFAARNLFDGRDLCCMSFGAPKAGNVHFARIHNQLVPNSFRIVNDTDLVARMPRSVASSLTLSRYSHAGRTILVNDEGEYWIEGRGEVAGSFVNPLRERYKNLSDLVEFEQRLWEQLMSGRSVQNHMEDSYFVAMQRVLKKFKADRTA